MPVDLPPNKKPALSAEAALSLRLNRSLNWLAVLVFFVLLVWIYEFGWIPAI